MSKAIFAAAINHEEAFLAASKNEDIQATGLNGRIQQAVSKEMYELGRRSTLQSSPDVRQKEIFITTSIAKRGDQNPEGVILAQGDEDNGYGLFILDGKVNFVVNHGGTAYKAVTSQPLPERFDLMASLGKDGQMVIGIDGNIVAQENANSLFSELLSPSLRSGRDFGDSNVGDYEGESAFEGNFQNLTLELK